MAQTNFVKERKFDWEYNLPSILWAYQMAYKLIVGTSQFQVVYVMSAIFPFEVFLSTL